MIWKGSHNPILRGRKLTMLINHWNLNGMILQGSDSFFSDFCPFITMALPYCWCFRNHQLICRYNIPLIKTWVFIHPKRVVAKPWGFLRHQRRIPWDPGSNRRSLEVVFPSPKAHRRPWASRCPRRRNTWEVPGIVAFHDNELLRINDIHII